MTLIEFANVCLDDIEVWKISPEDTKEDEFLFAMSSACFPEHYLNQKCLNAKIQSVCVKDEHTIEVYLEQGFEL